MVIAKARGMSYCDGRLQFIDFLLLCFLSYRLLDGVKSFETLIGGHSFLNQALLGCLEGDELEEGLIEEYLVTFEVIHLLQIGVDDVSKVTVQ